MEISVKGKHVKVGGALRDHVEEGLNATVTKYFDKGLVAHTVFSREGRTGDETLPAQQYVVAGDGDEGEVPADGEPAIIAEMSPEIATLTVGQAVMRMDTADARVIMFRNRAHGGFNVVYRRPDGTVGWIDPANMEPHS